MAVNLCYFGVSVNCMPPIDSACAKRLLIPAQAILMKKRTILENEYNNTSSKDII